MVNHTHSFSQETLSSKQYFYYLEKFSRELGEAFCDASPYFDALNFVKENLFTSEDQDDLARLMHRSQEIIVRLEHALRLVNAAFRNVYVLCDRAEKNFYTAYSQERIASEDLNAVEVNNDV